MGRSTLLKRARSSRPSLASPYWPPASDAPQNRKKLRKVNKPRGVNSQRAPIRLRIGQRQTPRGGGTGRRRRRDVIGSWVLAFSTVSKITQPLVKAFRLRAPVVRVSLHRGGSRQHAQLALGFLSGRDLASGGPCAKGPSAARYRDARSAIFRRARQGRTGASSGPGTAASRRFSRKRGGSRPACAENAGGDGCAD